LNVKELYEELGKQIEQGNEDMKVKVENRDSEIFNDIDQVVACYGFVELTIEK
jgi:adenylyl- and sulfurtransferase ThiI